MCRVTCVAAPVRRFVGLLLVQRGVKKLIKWLPEVPVAQPKAGRSSQCSPSLHSHHPFSPRLWVKETCPLPSFP